MREIKFRAWQKHHKKILAVIGIRFELSGEIEYVQTFKENQVPDKITYHNYKNAEYNLFDNDGEMVLDLMQCTGLKDVNGVEIYEGDIVVIRYSEHGYHYCEQIIFENGAFLASDEDWLCNVYEYCEVCGNIYENPELL